MSQNLIRPEYRIGREWGGYTVEHINHYGRAPRQFYYGLKTTLVYCLGLDNIWGQRGVVITSDPAIREAAAKAGLLVEE